MTTTRLWAVVLLGLVAGLLPVMSPAPALADAGLEQRFVASVNAERTAAGLPGLSPAGDLTTAARRHAETMAATEHLHHNPGLGTAVGGWQKIGENVGRGPDVDAIHQAFMDSPGHRRNVLDPAFTEVGIGVVVRDGQIWVTEMFRLPSGATPSAPTPAEPKPAAPQQTDPEPAATPQHTDPEPVAPQPASTTSAGTSAQADGGDAPPASETSTASDAADARTDPEPRRLPLQQDRMLLVQMRLASHDA